MRAVIFPRVPPRSARVSPAVTHGAPPPEAALCGGGCESRAVSGEYPQDYIRYVGTVVGDAVSGEYLQDYIRYVGTAVSESIFKTIYDMRGWR